MIPQHINFGLRYTRASGIAVNNLNKPHALNNLHITCFTSIDSNKLLRTCLKKRCLNSRGRATLLVRASKVITPYNGGIDPSNMNKESRDTSSVLSEFWRDWGERRLISSGYSMAYEYALRLSCTYANSGLCRGDIYRRHFLHKIYL